MFFQIDFNQKTSLPIQGFPLLRVNSDSNLQYMNNNVHTSISVSKSTKFNSIFSNLTTSIELYINLKPIDAALYVTLLIFCVDSWPEPQLLILAAFALILRPLTRSSIYWWCILAVFVGTNWIPVHKVPSHHYVLVIWCAAIAVALRKQSPQEYLAKCARWLTGLLFLTSTILSATEIMSGGNLNIFINATSLPSPTVSIYTLLLKIAVALMFLLPSQLTRSEWQHALLLVFMFTCYPFTPISGLGWTLVAMGSSQIKPYSKFPYILFYLCSFFLIFILENPILP